MLKKKQLEHVRIIPNFQILYRHNTPSLFFVSEEESCPGIAKHMFICYLDYPGMHFAARDIVYARSNFCTKMRRAWYRWFGR